MPKSSVISIDQKEADDPENETNSGTKSTDGSRKGRTKLDENLPPITDINEIFADLTQKAMTQGLSKVLDHLGSRPLRVATMCSGTESPLLALGLVKDYLKTINKNLNIKHLFSAEIDVFKQAYIERNFAPDIIFRDVLEMGQGDHGTTAYGARIPIPEDGIDLLVAGPSCVDFSALNTKKRGWENEDKGESAETCRAVICFATRSRPSLIVIENVANAPWTKIQEEFENAGYFARYVKLDTKDFYIPHTRQRGYLICIAKNKIPNARSSVEIALKYLNNFKRPASAPVEAFLLPEDDPRVHRARRDFIKDENGEDKEATDADWIVCQGRYAHYRHQKKLGNLRPMTYWQPGGTCSVPDYVWKDWAQVQGERVLDTLDIAYLRKAAEGIDTQYKTRIWDLSQNVDRFTDTAPSGIATCITPKGAFYVTTRGGPLLGVEALALQGLPIDKLLLTRESNSNLHDLAGNAMTSTVVGAAMLSALIAGYKSLAPGADREMAENVTDERELKVIETKLSHQPLNLDAQKYMSTLALLEASKRSSRLCSCEGGIAILRCQFKRCKQCNHTSCYKCAGNPSHDYVVISDDEIKKRIPTEDFKKLLKRVLPMVIQLSGLTKGALEDILIARDIKLDNNTWEIYTRQIVKAVKQPLRFSSIDRRFNWTIEYHSSSSKAELVFESGRAHWRFYAVAPPDLPANDRLRKLLAHPFARMEPEEDDLFSGHWQFGFWIMSDAEIRINSSSKTIPSWEMRLGLQGDGFPMKRVSKSLRVWSSENILPSSEQDIFGTYKLLPTCGTASSSLYSRLDQTKPPLFLFLDPDRIGDPKEDCFVFSRTVEHMRYGQEREIIVRLDSRWRPPKYDECNELSCSAESLWIDLPSLGFVPSLPALSGYVSSPGRQFQLTASSQSCHTCIVFLHFRIDSELLSDSVSNSAWTDVKSIYEENFLSKVSWLFQRTRSNPALGEWQTVRSTTITTRNCPHCAPALPKVIWVKNSNTDAITVMEEPQSAARYERVLKSRPPPFLIQSREDEYAQSHVRLSINAVTLAHRAQANLPCQSSDVVELTCRLVCKNDTSSFTRLPFSLSNNRNDPAARQPPNFKLNLREEQLRSLTWMIRQESEYLGPFLVEEVEEAIIPQLGWRAEGRATKMTRIRGGLLADEVGYGKTATTLALIDSQASSFGQPSNIEGKIAVNATLIIAPYHLLTQWKGEITKFLGTTYKVESIPSLASLNKMTVKKFKDADIILTTWNILENQGYLNRLVALTNTQDKPKGARAVITWYEESLKLLDSHVEILKSLGPKELDNVLRKKRNEVSAVDIVDYAPSKRFKGKKYEENSNKVMAQYWELNDRNTGLKRKRDETDTDDGKEIRKVHNTKKINLEEIILAFGLARAKSLDEVKSPLFQMFHFNRIVLDEYSYLAGEERVYVLSLLARSKFALSGTPPLGDFAEVKRIATFLGLHIGVDNISPGSIKASSIKAILKEYTKSEELLSYAKTCSAAWHQRRHDIAQSFLDFYVRQNVPEIDEIPLKEEYIAINLPSLERACYLELQQQAATQTLKLRSIKAQEDSSKILNERIVAESDSVQEALIKGCSYFPWSNSAQENVAIQHPCETIVSKRRADLSDIDEQLQILISNAIKLRQRCAMELKDSIHLSILLYDQFFEEIQRNTSGDLQSSKIIESMYDRAAPIDSEEEPILARDEFEKDRATKIPKIKGRSKITSKPAEDIKITDKRKYEKAAMLRELVVDLRRLTRDRIGCQRSLRLIENIFAVQKLDRGNIEVHCSAPACTSGPLQRSQVSIIGICGHLICNSCLKGLNQNAPCVAKDCPIDVVPSRLYSGHFLGRFDDHFYRTGYQGKKIEELIYLIKKIPRGEQALLFIQFANLAERVQAALIAAHIKVAFIKKGSQGDVLAKFQGEAHNSDQTEVLMCCIDDESASGSNLARCNHVIFFSTLLAPSLDQFKATMKQAVGRARRYGQKRIVNVYHMVALNTIEVDILQHRNRKVLVKTGPMYELVDGASIPDGCSQRFGSGLGHGVVSSPDEKE